MRKSDKMILVIYVLIGLALLVIGITSQMEYYSAMLLAMGVGLTSSSIMQFVRYYYNTRPENMESYQKKVRQQEIDRKDERKVYLRNRAGYIAWAVTLSGCFAAAFVAAVLRAGSLVVGVLAGMAVLEYVIAAISYRYLCKKM